MYWPAYVPVAQRREKAAKQMQRLQKQGKIIQPIEIEGRTISKTFWGKGWCSHMESFCDYDNRLPRGRTYVRNGSVCHLEINTGHVKAMVSGSSIYNIHIEIKPLVEEKWQAIKSTCAGQISSLLDLLSGKLTEGVMDIVSHPNDGLFPSLDELKLSCDCPDGALMCKHVAATLYGVGSRLDASPEQLFKLRGVNFEELIDVNQAVLEVTKSTQGRRKRLDETAFSDLFHLETSNESATELTFESIDKTKSFPKSLTGHAILEKRTTLNLTKNEFAKRIGVSVSSIGLWEAKANEVIRLNATSFNKLQAIW